MTKIERPESDRGLLGQLLTAFRAQHGEDEGVSPGEVVLFILQTLADWGLIRPEHTGIPSVMAGPPRMSESEIIDSLRTAAGFFNRPGDLRFEIAEVASYGVVSFAEIVGEGVVVFRDGGLSFKFTSGLPALDSLIASLLMTADSISALKLIAYASRTDDSAASPVEVEEALAKLKWRYGGETPSPAVVSLGDDRGEKMVQRLASRLWIKLGHYRHGGPFEQAEGTPAYNDCMAMARETLS